MNNKKIIATVLVLTMLGLCACAKSEDKAADALQETTAAQPQEAQTEAPETEAPKQEAATEAAKEAKREPAKEAAPKEPSGGVLHLTCTTVNKGGSVGENYEGDASVRYPQFELYEADAEKYPKLKSALQKLDERYEEEYAEHLKYSIEIGEEALADGVDMQISFFDYLTPEVCRADSHIVSIRENYDTYTGGVHGYNSFYGDNYDTQTGKELTLDDVVTDLDAFKETVKEKLYEQYPGEEFGNLDESLADLGPSMGDVSIWTMDYSGITLYFNPYYLTAYASGMQVITVPFDEDPELFVQDYLDVPDMYVEQLNERIPAVLDVNGDGMNESIIISEDIPEDEMNDEGYDSGYRTWTINCGGDSVTVSDYCYRSRFYLVHANDQYYIHIFAVSDNDYSLYKAVDLKTMENDTDRTFNAWLMTKDTGYESDDKGYRSGYIENVYTDPENVYLSSRVEVLGSNTGVKLYGTGSDGWLKSDSEYFDVYISLVYKTKQDAECIQVDEAGNETGKAVLKAGKYYQLVRSDNKTFADLQELSADDVEETDGYPYFSSKAAGGLDNTKPVYRLPVDISKYPRTVNGIPEEEIFDGILYAG